MTDTASSETRSKIMRSVKSVSRLELDARPGLESLYGTNLLHHAKPAGYPYMPDYYDPKTRTVIFINGCFWHACDEHYKPPETRKHYWERKMASNRRRDAVAWLAAIHRGYRVHVVWEHELREPKLLSEQEAQVEAMSEPLCPCLRKEDRNLALRVAGDAQREAEKVIDNAQAEKGAGNVADWVSRDLRAGRAMLKSAMQFKARVEATPECN